MKPSKPDPVQKDVVQSDFFFSLDGHCVDDLVVSISILKMEKILEQKKKGVDPPGVRKFRGFSLLSVEQVIDGPFPAEDYWLLWPSWLVIIWLLKFGGIRPHGRHITTNGSRSYPEDLWNRQSMECLTSRESIRRLFFLKLFRSVTKFRVWPKYLEPEGLAVFWIFFNGPLEIKYANGSQDSLARPIPTAGDNTKREPTQSSANTGRCYY